MLVRFLVMLMAMILLIPPGYADVVSKPTTYVPGQTLPASTLNNNFDTIYNEFNGNISNANVKSGAAIDPAKMDLTKAYGPILRSAAAEVFSVGVTSDTLPRLRLTSDGYIYLGPGGSSALDLLLKRQNSTTFALRDAADSADANLTAANLTLSGTFTLPSQSPNLVFSSPDSSSGVPSFRALVDDDLPVVSISNGGTGQTDRTAGFNALAPASPSKGDILAFNSVVGDWVKLTNSGAGDDGKVLELDSAQDTGVKWGTAGAGTVSSFSATPTSVFDVTNPTSTPALSLDSQAQNIVLASPDSSTGTPAFRALVNNDLPTVSETKGGTGQTSYAKGNLLVASGASTLVKLSPGINGQILSSDSAEVSGLKWINSSSAGGDFGGTGADGAINQTSATETAVRTINATTYTINSSSVNYTMLSGSTINCTGKFKIDGGSVANLIVNPSIAGPTGRAGIGRDGAGIGGGKGSLTEGMGAGGGGFGGAGGDGDGLSASSDKGFGGPAYDPTASMTGSCGGSGSWDTANSTGSGGKGGDAGGSLRIISASDSGLDDLELSSTYDVTCRGGNGGNGTGGTNTSGGAGGSGGFLGLYAKGQISIDTFASATIGIQLQGGTGGNGQGTGKGGAGGSGGYFIAMANAIDTSEGSDAIANVHVEGGAAGTGGSSSAGANGVKLKILSTPSLPLISLYERRSTFEFFQSVYAFSPRNKRFGIEVELDDKQACGTVAALYAPEGKFYETRMALFNAPGIGCKQESVTCLGIGNFDEELEVLNAA